MGGTSVPMLFSQIAAT
ncbi:DUF6053 domain-containing protein [Lysobacter enzymogenes]